MLCFPMVLTERSDIFTERGGDNQRFVAGQHGWQVINQLGRAVGNCKVSRRKSMEFCERLFQLIVTGIRIMDQTVEGADQGIANHRRHAERIYASGKIEDLIGELKENYTIIIVTHSMQQAARVSDRTAFFYIGKLIEMDETDTLFTRPRLKQTEDYITGRFG